MVAARRRADWARLIHTESTAQKTAIVDELLEVAGEAGVPPAQVARLSAVSDIALGVPHEVARGVQKSLAGESPAHVA